MLAAGDSAKIEIDRIDELIDGSPDSRRRVSCDKSIERVLCKALTTKQTAKQEAEGANDVHKYFLCSRQMKPLIRMTRADPWSFPGRKGLNAAFCEIVEAFFDVNAFAQHSLK